MSARETPAIERAEVLRSLRWQRLAEPNVDGDAARTIAWLVAHTTTAARPAVHVRGVPVGRVAVAPLFDDAERCAADLGAFADAPPDDPRIEEGFALVRRWEAGHAEVRELIEHLHPALDPEANGAEGACIIHSASHSTEARFGALWATIDSPIGLAQALVHEMSHHKLRALGVSAETPHAVVANDPGEVHPSPLVAWPRPLSAVLHAHYALLHVTALDAALLRTSTSRAERAALTRSFAWHAAQMRRSARTLREHLVVDAFGVSFMQGMWAWMERVLRADDAS